MRTRRYGSYRLLAALALSCLLFSAIGRGASGQIRLPAPPAPQEAEEAVAGDEAGPPGRAGGAEGRGAPPGPRPAPAPGVPPRLVEPPRQPIPTPPAPAPGPSMLAYSSPILRLASVPNMLGDSFQMAGQLELNSYEKVLVDLPLAGGSRRVKIAENNKALPHDRYYFMYHHFHNALETSLDVGNPGVARSSLDRFVIGLEKTFRDDLWSVDVRMPFVSDYGYAAPGLAVEGGEVGNLSVTLKRLLLASDTCAVAAGLGIDTPTGRDVTVRIGQDWLTVRNDAVYLSPYVGFLSAPGDRLFCHGFLQIDVPAGGNRVELANPGRDVRLHDQTLMYLDVSAGYWLYRNRSAAGLTGLAPLVEFHYTTTLQDADLVTGTLDGADFQLGNLLNRVDVVNLSVGLHAEVGGRTTVRAAGVFPLDGRPERFFDAEFQLSINRRF